MYDLIGAYDELETALGFGLWACLTDNLSEPHQMVPSLNCRPKTAEYAKRKYQGTNREYLPHH